MSKKATAVQENKEETQQQAQSVEFSEVAESAVAGSGSGSIDILLDMAVPITVNVGRTEMSVRRLLQLGPGSVLKLEKCIDEPVDLYLNDTKFATGSVVVVDDCFAVRIKEVLNPGESVDGVDKE